MTVSSVQKTGGIRIVYCQTASISRMLSSFQAVPPNGAACFFDVSGPAENDRRV